MLLAVIGFGNFAINSSSTAMGVFFGIYAAIALWALWEKVTRWRRYR